MELDDGSLVCDKAELSPNLSKLCNLPCVYSFLHKIKVKFQRVNWEVREEGMIGIRIFWNDILDNSDESLGFLASQETMREGAEVGVSNAVRSEGASK